MERITSPRAARWPWGCSWPCSFTRLALAQEGAREHSFSARRRPRRLASGPWSAVCPLVDHGFDRSASRPTWPGHSRTRTPGQPVRQRAEVSPASDHTVVRLNIDALFVGVARPGEGADGAVRVPDTHGRYYMMPMLDAWTDIFASPGSAPPETRPGISRSPDRAGRARCPASVKRNQRRRPTRCGSSAGPRPTGRRTTPAVNALQKQYKLTP